MVPDLDAKASMSGLGAPDRSRVREVSAASRDPGNVASAHAGSRQKLVVERIAHCVAFCGVQPVSPWAARAS